MTKIKQHVNRMWKKF